MPRMSMALVPHISAVRSVEFLLRGEALDEAEHAHLIRCDGCMQAMVKAASEELQERSHVFTHRQRSASA